MFLVPLESQTSLVGFREKILSETNKKRQLHGASPLFLDTKLNDAAQAFATQLAKEQAFKHSDPNSRPNEGENIYKECISHCKYYTQFSVWGIGV